MTEDTLAVRRNVVMVCRRLYERGLVAGQDGNVSVRLDDAAFQALSRLEATGLSRSEAIRVALIQASERLRDRRFETEGEWKNKLAGGTRGTVEVLSRELREALR